MTRTLSSLLSSLVLLLTAVTGLSAQTHTLKSLNGPDGAVISEIDITPDGRYFVSTPLDIYYHGPFDKRFVKLPTTDVPPSIAVDSNGMVYYSNLTGVGVYEAQTFRRIDSLSILKNMPGITILDRTIFTTFSGKVMARSIAGVWVRDSLPSPIRDVQSKADTLVVLTSAGLYYKLDAPNAQWTKIETEIVSGIKTFELTPVGLVIGTATDGVWLADTIGGSVRSISLDLEDWQINDVLYSGGRIFTSHPNNVYITSDLGVTWIEGNDRIRTLRVGALAAHNGNVYAASDGLFFSEDNGDSWRALNVGFAESEVTAIIEYKDRIWTGSNTSAVHSFWPAGDLWLDHNKGLRSNGTVNSFIIHADTLYALEQRGGLYKWIWDSTLWRSVPLTFSFTSLYKDMEMLDENTVVIVSESVHILDLVTGKFTRKQFGEFQIHDVEIANGKIYLGSDSGLYISSDRGATWESISNGIFHKVAVLDGAIIAEVTASRLMRTLDNGATREVLDERLDDLPKIDDKLYAIRNVMYVSSDKGSTWQRFADKSISSLGDLYRTSTGRMLLGVNSEGLMEAVMSSGVGERVEAHDLKIRTSPNSFSSKITISFEQPAGSPATISIYDATGHVVHIATARNDASPSQSIEWDASDLPSGTYIVEVCAGDQCRTTKILLTK
ncbi:MAG TPA: T9SS type A sorting domain-containing protein [Candidatus Kapabacteria bacterium]|nr:T9SS type A sorting domain-containing protein [Candidatus Kapabacteria bacterium]